MDDDWFMESVQIVGDAAGAARSALSAVVESLQGALEDRRAQVPLMDVVDGLLENDETGVRASAIQAIVNYERALLSFRAGILSHLVADDGLTLTEASRHLGISRQRAARLLAAAADGSPAQDTEDRVLPPVGT